MKYFKIHSIAYTRQVKYNDLVFQWFTIQSKSICHCALIVQCPIPNTHDPLLLIERWRTSYATANVNVSLSNSLVCDSNLCGTGRFLQVFWLEFTFTFAFTFALRNLSISPDNLILYVQCSGIEEIWASRYTVAYFIGSV